jgi:hypothetical protein
MVTQSSVHYCFRVSDPTPPPPPQNLPLWESECSNGVFQIYFYVLLPPPMKPNQVVILRSLINSKCYYYTTVKKKGFEAPPCQHLHRPAISLQLPYITNSHITFF